MNLIQMHKQNICRASQLTKQKTTMITSAKTKSISFIVCPNLRVQSYLFISNIQFSILLISLSFNMHVKYQQLFNRISGIDSYMIVGLFKNQQYDINILIISLSVKLMQITQARSSSKKSSRGQKDSPDVKQKSNSYLIATKIGDLSQRNQTTCSKELDNRKNKNQADNTEYIRNLYKKYLGKENQNNSDRKTKTDIKDIKPDKILPIDNYKKKLSYQQEAQLLKVQPDMDRPSPQSSLFRKMSNFQQNKQSQIMKAHTYGRGSTHPNFYNKMLDNQILNLIGNQRSSIVLSIQRVNAIRLKYR